MKFIDWLFRRKPQGHRYGSHVAGSETDQIRATKAVIEKVAVGEGPAAGRFPKLADASPAVLTQTPTSATVAKDGPAPSVNIWDLDGGPAEVSPPVTSPQPAPEGGPRRRPTRTKTRVLGFEPQPAAVVPLFDEGRMDEEAQPAHKANLVMFPTGWLVVKAGPGRGAAFALGRGLNQVGRGTDQTVALDFGDMAISRQNHAAIAYDVSSHTFHVGHGGKSNLVRLNGKPLLSTEPLKDGDEIQIGETTLLLKVLCTPEFNWSSAETEGDGHDMAIA